MEFSHLNSLWSTWPRIINQLDLQELVHQDSVTEHGIRTMVDMARTEMIHAALYAPEGVITTDL